MSNEELVKDIQGGSREKLTELWAQVERLVWRMANRRPDTGAVDREDLYQAGYLALVAAVDSYDPASGAKFSTWLYRHLLTAFNEASNYRSERQRRDPMHTADSLDRPLGDEPDADTLAAIVADPTGEAALEDMEAHIWQDELHTALETALNTLPDDQSDTLRRRYYRGQTVEQVAQETGTTATEVHKAADKGLRALRRSKVTPQLRAFIEERTPYYRNWAAGSGERTAEQIVLIREQLKKQCRKDDQNEYVF